LSINGGQIPFSPELLQAGIKATGFQQISKMDGVMNKLKIATTNKNISEVYGATEASSTGVRIN
jgi:acyl-CoA synthetase (AMP-forming)/AMP-acid ligase II